MAGGKNKIHEHKNANTNGFDKNPQNIGNGRKRKIYTILKEQGYSKDDFNTAIGELFWYNLKELQQVHKDDNKPVIVRIISNQLFLALKNGDFKMIKDLAEHYLGKPNQRIETDLKADIQSTVDFNKKKVKDILEQLNDNI